MNNTRAAFAAAALYHACLGGSALLLALVPTDSAVAQSADFSPVGTFGAYRIDGVRDALHEGARVRLVDMTLHNRSNQTTFPATIQDVWWQGRNNGEKIEARRRDLSRFGMYDFIKPGEQVPVTYIVPVRSDIDGIRVEYMKAPKGQQRRRWTWDELIGGGSGTLYHKGRRLGSAASPAAGTALVTPAERKRATAPAAGQATSAKAPDLGASKEAVDTLTNGRTSLPTKRSLKGLLGNKLKSLPF
jgi:hypothetical protein